MNREIRFRIWYPTQGMQDWNKIKEKTMQVLEFADSPIMQYTGIKDICSKDIYEGDIVEFFITKTPLYHVVIWYYGEFRTIDLRSYVSCACCGNALHARTGTKPNQSSWRSFKVVGNIYENKEFLKEKNEKKTEV